MKDRIVYLLENVVFWIVAIGSSVCDGARAVKWSLVESGEVWVHLKESRVPAGLSTGRNTDQDGRFN